MPDVITGDRRCPYCDTDAEELDQDLGDHVMACQPFRIHD